MNISRTLFAALLASASLTACVDPGDEATVDVTSSNLSSTWFGTNNHFQLEDLTFSPAMATLNNVEVYVYAWDPDPANPDGVYHQLYWHRCDTDGNCTAPHKIDNHLSAQPVSLAAFNGKIYMLHVGEFDVTSVWESSLDLDTGVWSPDQQVMQFSVWYGAPALAAFDGRLYAVGNSYKEVARRGGSIDTYPMWWASAGVDGLFGPEHPMTSQSSIPVSVAVLDNTLYAANGTGNSSGFNMEKMVAGTSVWSAPMALKTAGNVALSGWDVKLASVNGYLHVVHRLTSGDQYYWTYNRGCDNFAPEVKVPSFGSETATSLATGVNGTLKLNRLHDIDAWPYTDYQWEQLEFVAPPTPQTVPNCGAQ